MWHDPIVEEIHKLREEYARQLDFDIDAICKDIQVKQAEGGTNWYRFQLVSLNRRKSLPDECSKPTAYCAVELRYGFSISACKRSIRRLMPVVSAIEARKIRFDKNPMSRRSEAKPC